MIKNKNLFPAIAIGLALIALVVGLMPARFGLVNQVGPAFLLVGVVLLVLGCLKLKTKHHRTIVNVLFLLPLVVTFMMTVAIPFVLGIFYSLTDWNGIGYSKFLGLENYIKMFSASDYLYSFTITFVYSFLSIALVNLIAFLLALLCTSQIKGVGFFQASFFIPNLIGGIVLGYVWQFIFNKVLVAIIPGSTSMLTKPNTAILAILIVSSWQYIGYIMMIYITGLKAIPSEVMEAAKVDGADGLRSLLKVKIPMMASSFTICMFLTVINSFKQFDLNYSITNGAPSRIIKGLAVPSTEFLALNIYRTAIVKSDYAFGQAKAVVFFVILAIVSLTQVYLSKKKEIEV